MEFEIQPVLSATDIHRAKHWYSDKLGLEPVSIEGEPLAPGSNTALQYDTGTARFSIYYTPHAGNNKATAVRLLVDDFDTAHAELLAKGVTFDTFDVDLLNEPDGTPYWENGALISPDGEKTAWFQDSEGNVLSIGTVWG